MQKQSRRPYYKQFLLFLLLGVVLCVGACNEVPVAEDVDQKQALEIVALLNSNGIGAAAAKGRSGFTVEVKKKSYSQAVSLMKDNNLPGEVRMSFRELVGEQGLIPSSRDVEAVRLDHALAVELEDSMQKHSGVAAVKAVVRLNFRKEGSLPGVSVVMQRKPGASLDKEEITKAVQGTVPGVARENISVIITPASSDAGTAVEVGKVEQDGKVLSVPLASFLFWRVPEGSLVEMVFTFIALLLLAVMVGALVGYTAGSYRQSRYQLMRDMPEAAVLTSLKLEKGRKSLPGV